ncbi:hypothetical protein HAZT_HAZT005697 [Hyalella azteca]|uniref:Protein kinase domain-containing protein n=1 Tax=Hyalella azteca TaxID=294128 RepID=A0A6A0GS27_HYAAZ|nr:hypothetical protein HAZT_HAZT005697 [Hyalella azteca]
MRQCPFVVRFEGAVVQGPNMYILMEMVYNFAIQIADGMAYIASNRIIHIDLAPKNCLITRRFLVKIADFGLSRKLAPERCCYHYQIDLPHRKRLKIYLPSFIAPEERRTQDLHSGHECIVFFLKSDVWSYGVLLWQLITCSNKPYAGKEPPAPKDVQTACLWLEGPGRAAKTAELLNSCWMDNQDLRPSFEQIVEQLLPMISPEFTSTEDEGVGSMPGSSRGEVESCQDLAEQVELSRAQGYLRFLSRSGWPPSFNSRHPTFNIRHRAGDGDTGQMTSTRAKTPRFSFHASAEKYLDMSPKNPDGLCLDHSSDLDDGAVCSSYVCGSQPEETSLDDNLCGYTEICGTESVSDIPSVASTVGAFR